MIHYSTCPVCNAADIAPGLSAKDYTVSSEIFQIFRCNHCTAMFTQDVPDQQNIGSYYASENYISHSNTQTGFINKLYHRIRKRTLAAKRNLIKNETGKSQGNLLDIGCGTGAFLNEMSSGGWKITGLEPDETARKNAQQLFGIEPQSPEKLFSLEKETYDAITMWHVLEHVHQLQEYILQIKTLLTQNGRAFIALPNYTSYDAQNYKECWAAYDVPRHLYHFSPESMEMLVKKHGMEVKKIKPMWYDSFYVSMLSEKYRNGKGNILSAFFTGLLSNLKAIGDNKKGSSIIYIIGK